MTRVLLIGGGGYVGVELQRFLCKNNYSVRVFDTFWFSRGKWPQASFSGAENLEYVTGDIRNLELLKQSLRNVDICIHLACISNDPSYELHPDLSKDINYYAFREFLPILNASSVTRFIFASSSSVYGIKDEPDVTEDLSCEPISDYSKYKLMCEESLLADVAEEICTTILRPSTVCGVSRRQRFDLVVNALTLNALTSGKVFVDGGDQFRPNLHLRDMLSAYLRVMTAETTRIDRKIFNVAGENLRVSEIAKKVKEQIGAHIEVVMRPVIDPRSYRVSGKKIKDDLGFIPNFKVEDAIRDLEKAYLDGHFGDTTNPEFYNIKQMQLLNLG